MENSVKNSVLLSTWPKVEGRKIDPDLESNFGNVLKSIELGLRERDKNGLGLKWPLNKATIRSKKAIAEEFFDILKEQLNVKKY